MWTNLVVAHAPYKGSATASTENGKATYVQYDFEAGSSVAWGISATSSSSIDLSTDSGKTSGTFKLAQWAQGDAYRYCSGAGSTGPYPTAWLHKWKSTTLTAFPMQGASTLTDSDDPGLIVYNGYESPSLKNWYNKMDEKIDHHGQGTSTFNYHRERNIYVGGSVSVDTPISIAMSFKYTQSSSTHYKVTLNDGEPICLAVDWLGTQSSMRPTFHTIAEAACAGEEAPEFHPNGLPDLPIVDVPEPV